MTSSVYRLLSGKDKWPWFICRYLGSRWVL